MANDSDRGAERSLSALAAVADVATGHLDVDDLLNELLARVVELLDADTSAVLLLDSTGERLQARAAYGIEEEVRQGVRVPLGVGFAGRIAATRLPVKLDVVGPSTVWNPILWEKGILKMVGVPLQVGQSLLGVLHVGRIADVSFTDDDVALLQLVAARVAASIQARELEVERAAGRVVQRSLLPSALPDLPGFEFATRFVPAEEGGVGGDWYDAFVLPDGNLWVMTGDIAGHGLEAAITMGRLRAALRAYALQGHGPEEVLALADQKLQFFDPGQMATVVCALARPPYDHVQIASAGHPPPVLAIAGEPAVFVGVAQDAALGVTTAVHSSVTIGFPVGAVLLLYTDGLVERRGESIEDGLGRLAAVLVAGDPELVCRDVMAALVGADTPGDDIALLAIRRSPVS